MFSDPGARTSENLGMKGAARALNENLEANFQKLSAMELKQEVKVYIPFRAA